MKHIIHTIFGDVIIPESDAEKVLQSNVEKLKPVHHKVKGKRCVTL